MNLKKILIAAIIIVMAFNTIWFFFLRKVEIPERAIGGQTYDALNIGDLRLKQLEGKKVPWNKEDNWGPIWEVEDTLSGLYILYFDQANINLIVDSTSRKVVYAEFGYGSEEQFVIKRLIEQEQYD